MIWHFQWTCKPGNHNSAYVSSVFAFSHSLFFSRRYQQWCDVSLYCSLINISVKINLRGFTIHPSIEKQYFDNYLLLTSLFNNLLKYYWLLLKFFCLVKGFLFTSQFKRQQFVFPFIFSPFLSFDEVSHKFCMWGFLFDVLKKAGTLAQGQPWVYLLMSPHTDEHC